MKNNGFSSRIDTVFYKSLFTLTLPIALQHVLMASLFVIDTMIISRLGDSYIAAVGQANKISMIMWCAYSAISSAGAVFAAQFWGKNRDLKGISRALGASLMFGGIIAAIFFGVAFFFGREAMTFLSDDPQVVILGANYLKIISFAYLVQMLSFMYASILRATNHTHIPLFASVISVLTNIVLDVVLVFGVGPFPRLEERGAAIATTIACVVDFAALIIFAKLLHAPIVPRFKSLVRPTRAFSLKFIKIAWPMLIKDSLWGFGVMAFSIVFASMGTPHLAAYNVFGTIAELLNLFFLAVGSAGGILIGQILGAGELDRARLYANKLLRIIVISGLVLIFPVIYWRDLFLLPFPNLSVEAQGYYMQALVITTVIIWSRGVNFTNMNGILRAGGDTVGAAIIDVGIQWGIGVPLTFLAGMVFGLPFWQVYAVLCIEEIAKTIVGTWRVRSGKWVRQLV